jgi:HSP20 family molecular chaperone IbpA
MGWDPFGEMVPFVQQGTSEFAPSFEIKETKDAYVFKADVPGVKDSDLDITVTGNRLSVAGKREAEKHLRLRLGRLLHGKREHAVLEVGLHRAHIDAFRQRERSL